MQDLDKLPDRFEIRPTPNGEQMVSGDMRGQTLKVEIVSQGDSPRQPGGLSLGWTGDPDNLPTTPTKPPTNDDEPLLDWVTPLRKVYSHLPDPRRDSPYAGLNPNAVTSVVTLVEGAMTAAGYLTKKDDVDKYESWEFIDPDSSRSAHEQALAARITLIITGLDDANDYVQIGTSGWTIKLNPRLTQQSKVQASFTHLPRREQNPDSSQQQTLDHFMLLDKMTDLGSDSPKPRIPRSRGPRSRAFGDPLGPRTTTNTFCPPIRYTD